MAKPAGLSFENPLYQDANGVPSAVVNPFGFTNAAASSGSDALRDDMASLAAMGERGVQLARQNRFTMPEMNQPSAPAYYSPASKQLFVQGVTFADDDAQSLLDSQRLLGGTPMRPPSGGDWVPIDQQTYSQFIQNVRNPSLGTLASRNFGRGVDSLQMMFGRGLQLAGAEQLGGRIVEQQAEDLRRTTPYERQFTDIESGRGAVEWLVANLAQQGPNLIESIATAGAGFLAGTAAGGPLAGAGGAMAGLLGKGAFKQSVLAAARKQAAGETLDPIEAKVLKEAAGIAGAVAASYAQNVATGAADIYGELREQGADAADTDARLKALAGSVPYAMLETLPEYVAALSIFRGGTRPAMGAAAQTLGGRGRELLRRGAVGGAVGGTLEGTTEVGQEGLVLGLSGQDMSSPENVDRLINAFAAGFGIGGPIGAVANLRSNKPANLLDPVQPSEPQPPTATGTSLVPTQPGGGTSLVPAPMPGPGTALATAPQPQGVFVGPEGIAAPPALAGPSTLPQLAGLVPPLTPAGPPMLAVTPGGVAYPDQMLRQQGSVPPGGVGTQGLLDVFGNISAQEVASRMQPGVAPVAEVAPAGVPQVNPAQGALQFAGPAPTLPVNTQMANQLQARQDRIRRQREFDQAEAQRQAEIQQQIDALAQQSQNARDLYQLQQEQGGTPTPMPMRQVGPRRPRQLELFTRKQAPRPSRAEGLRRGARLPEPTAPVALTAAERRKQGNLLTQEGQPTVAALKAAGKKTKVEQPAEKPRATQTRGARGVKKGARVTEVNVKETPSAAQEGKLKQGRQPERQQDNAGVQGGRDTGQQPKAQVQAGGAQAGGGGKSLKRGKVKAETLTEKEPPSKKPEAAPAAVTAEELWNEERVPGDVSFANLPAAAKAAWEESDRSGATQILILERLADDVLPMSATERLNYNIARADEALKTGDTLVLGDAMDDVVEAAYFTDETQQAKPLIAEAQAYLNDTTFTEAQQNVINESFLLAAEGQSLDAYYKGGSKKGAITPWFEYASRQAGLIQRLAKANVTFGNVPLEKAKALLDNGVVGPDNLPDSTIKALGKVKVKPEQAAGSKPQTSPAVKLAEKIEEINGHTGIPYSPAVQKKRIAELTALWKKVRDADLETPEADALLGASLDSFFDADGKPITGKVGGQFRVSNVEITPEVRAKREQALDEGGIEDDTDQPRFTLDDWESARDIKDSDTRFSTADGKRITKPVAVGRIRMAVNRFRSRLAIKPNIFVYANQADLKRRNPALYRQAVASRPEGDFDTANAVGVSFGRNIVIFSDRVATEDHLNFVLAHETVGHFGLRGLIPGKQFDALMRDIYDQSPAIRDAVDAAMATRQMDRAEAVEEYLSDFAAELDVSLVARIWNAIKGALNKLGVKFGDEAARYWVSQARRYVRNGEVGSAFNVGDVFARMNALEGGLDPDNTGRYALTDTLRDDNIAAGLMVDNFGGMPGSLAEAAKRVRDLVGDSFDSVDKFKSRFFSLLNFRARENPGLSELDRILRNGRGYAMSIKNAANENMAVVLNRAVASAVSGWSGVGGITEAQITQVNKMLYDAQRYAVAKLKPADLGKTPLFTVASDGTVVPNTPELDRIYKLGLLTFEQARDGYTYEVTYEEEGKTVTKEVKVAGIAGLDEKGPVWQGYLRTRETMREVEMQLLRARYSSYTQDRDLAFREIGDATVAKKLTVADQRFLERMYRKYRDLWVAEQIVDADGNPSFNPESIEQANDFLVKLNTALVGKGTDRNADVAAFFEGAADDVIDSLNDFKTRLVLDEENKFLVQNRMKDIIIAEVSNDGADLYTKTTLASGYVPVLREGGFQVRVVATNTAGKAVRLEQAYKEQLVYSQVETNSDARNLAAQINDMFGDKTYKVKAYNEDTRQYELMDVRLSAMPETAITEIAAPPELNLNEFTRGLRQFSITLPPQKLNEVIQALTRQNNSARNRLKRSFTPGPSPDAIKAVSQHIESRASVAAKILMRPKINELMNLNMTSTQRLWQGDKARLDQLKANYDRVMADPQSTTEQRVQAKREYDLYNFQYQSTNPEGGSARGNQYYNEAAGTLAFLDSNRNVDESDFGSGAVVSNIRAYTSLLQLGGSIATGALNYVGAITNGLPYLATYNDKTAFGGGFGMGRSIAEFQRALSQVGLLRALPGIGESGLNTAEFYDKVAASKAMQQQYGLTAQEARFMATEIREGEMIPAQSNALVGSARGRSSTGAGQKFIDGFMWTFNVTEQGARRGMGLAAYRLQYERSIAAGMTEADAAAAARDFAVNTLRFTMGDYSVTNRPPAWRSGVQSFLYMYKVFVTASIQMLSRLPRSGQLYMLGSLWLLGGVLAFPFADDLEDLIDTIAQGLGLPMASVQAELAKIIDGIAPGLSPYMLRGFANAALGINIADRVSLSDFIPGTGMLLAGADVGRELTEIAGPAASMLTGVASSIPRVTQAAFTERVTFVDAFRESPITMLRALGDTIAYGQAGAVIDKRGYVVSPEVNAGLMAARMLGFYPAEAAEQYNIVRVSKRITDYQKEVVAGFRTAWIKARISGDDAQVQAIEQAVADWNSGTQDTALEIRRFTANAQRALNEAQRPVKERLLRAASPGARSDLEQIADLLGYND